MNQKKHIFAFIAIISLLLSTYSCGIYKKTDAREVSPDPAVRVQKNISEGRGIKFGLGGKKNSGGNFDFASSNELWRAALEILDFLPLDNLDYAGGIIITDWYSEGMDNNESIKITVKFLSNEIRADGIDVTVHKRACNANLSNCQTTKIQSSLEEEITTAILRKAAFLKKNSKEKKVKEHKKKFSGNSNKPIKSIGENKDN